jgi:hypothetical protein
MTNEDKMQLDKQYKDMGVDFYELSGDEILELIEFLEDLFADITLATLANEIN